MKLCSVLHKNDDAGHSCFRLGRLFPRRPSAAPGPRGRNTGRRAEKQAPHRHFDRPRCAHAQARRSLVGRTRCRALFAGPADFSRGARAPRPVPGAATLAAAQRNRRLIVILIDLAPHTRRRGADVCDRCCPISVGISTRRKLLARGLWPETFGSRATGRSSLAH